MITAQPATGHQRAVLTGHTARVRALAVAPDSTWLASASWDQTVRTWDPATGQQRAILTGHTDYLQIVTISPDGSWLASGVSPALGPGHRYATHRPLR